MSGCDFHYLFCQVEVNKYFVSKDNKLYACCDSCFKRSLKWIFYGQEISYQKYNSLQIFK